MLIPQTRGRGSGTEGRADKKREGKGKVHVCKTLDPPL